jgi:hypothetical protein
MSRLPTSLALAVFLIAGLAACGGGGGSGGGGGGGATNGNGQSELDPSTDFFLTGLSMARAVFDESGELTQLVNPASLFESDPLTGVPLAGFPKVLNEGTSLASLAAIDFSQILDPLTPQVPLLPRNAALVMRFSMDVDVASLNLAAEEVDEFGTLSSTSTIQLRLKTGQLTKTRVFVDGPRVILLGTSETTVGFPASPLVFDQTGAAVEDSSGFMRLTLGPGVGVGLLKSTGAVPISTRTDKLGAEVRPVPINPGNGFLDAIVLQTDNGIVNFNGFLPDLSSPRIIRPVIQAGFITNITSSGGQLEIRDSSLVVLPNTSANGGLGEWASGLMLVTSAGGAVTSEYVVESNVNELGEAVYRLQPGAVLDPAVFVADTYTVSRTEYFEPLPPPFPSDPVQLARVTVDPEGVPRDPADPQDFFNSDLRYFVRVFDEGGVEQLDRWNPATSTFLAIPPKSVLRLQFSESMDQSSFDPYETCFVTDGGLPKSDDSFDSMRIGVTAFSVNNTFMDFRPFLLDQEIPGNSQFVGFGGTASPLRLVLRTIPGQAEIEGLLESGTPEVLAQLTDLADTGIRGCIDVGGRGLGLPAALLDQTDDLNFLLGANSPLLGPFPPSVDFSMEFETLPNADPDYGVIVHRFLGQPTTSIFKYDPSTVHDTVEAGVEYKDYPPQDQDGDGTIDRRFIYGPQVVEVGLNIPGRLTGAPATTIEHLIDDFNPPKPSNFASPNGEDFLISTGFGSSTPINSGFGARFQHIYRAGDASPSESDFRGVLLDLVGLAWSPFPLSTSVAVNTATLDDFELVVGLGNSNGGLGPNTNQTNGIPASGNSGLMRQFDCNRLEHGDDCCVKINTGKKNELSQNPQPPSTTVVRPGTTYAINSTNLFKPTNAGLSQGGFNLYLNYPTFNAGIDPSFGQTNVFSFPYDSRFPMLIEYSVGQNETPPPLNLYRFSPGILTSVLPRFRVWSQGQDPKAWGVPNWSLWVGGCSGNQPTPFLAGEGGPLLKPGSFGLPITAKPPTNGMPILLPTTYSTPPRVPSFDANGNCTSATNQASPGQINGKIDTDTMSATCGCITQFPQPSPNPESNYYFANGNLINPLPNLIAYPGLNGQPPTFFVGYGVPLGGVGAVTPNQPPCAIPIAQGTSNNPLVLANEPGATAPPARYGDNNRYYMMWKYRKRVSLVESPTIQVQASSVEYLRPIIDPPLSDVDSESSLVVHFRAGKQLNFAVSQLESGYVSVDEPDFVSLMTGSAADRLYVKFRCSFGVSPTSTQPPSLESIAIPYRKIAP